MRAVEQAGVARGAGSVLVLLCLTAAISCSGGLDNGAGPAGVIPGPVVTAVVTKRIHVGPDPSDLAVHPGTGDVYVTDGADDTVSVIDANAQRVTDSIAVGHEPADIAIDSRTGTVYVSNGGGAEDADEDEWSGTISVIDGEHNRVVDTIDLGKGKWPSGLAVDPSTRSLFVANNADATVSVIDTDTNDVVKTVQVGRSPSAVAVNPAAGEVYVDANGGVSVIDTRTREVEHALPESGGGDFAVDAAAGVLFVANEGDGTVAVVDTNTRTSVRSIRVGGRGPFSVEVDPAAARAYVTGAQDGTIAILDTVSLEVIERLAFPFGSAVFQAPVVHAATDNVYVILGPGNVGVIARR